ncbi:hypothetical protein BBJ28_00000012 [Nothophytophthora sp. Chile5]|nr:hypothetical protein BBJ28_00000012 [Nothophytophthora sp. Chile5]
MDTWSVLFPWCRLLRGRLQLEERELDAARSVLRAPWWLLLTLPKHRRSASSGHVQKLREALMLLALVATVDNAAFRQLLRDKCGVALGHLHVTGHPVDVDAYLAPRVILVLDDHAKESLLWPTALCNSFFALHGTQEPSEDFVLAKQEVAKIAAGLNGSNTLENVTIPFCLHFWPRQMDLHGLTQYLLGVLRVLQAVLSTQSAADSQPEKESENTVSNHDDDPAKDPADTTRALSCGNKTAPFVFEALQLNLRAFELNEPVARTLREIVALGGKLSCLQLPLKATDFLNDDECPRQPLADCLLAITGGGPRAQLFAPTASPELESDHPQASPASSTVEVIVVNDVGIDDRRFAALCSALRGSSGVRELVLESVFADDSSRARALKWKWLAYALFTINYSGEPRSSVRRLVINEPHLLAEDVMAIACIVNSRRPARELLDPLWAEHEIQRRQELETKSTAENEEESDSDEAFEGGDDLVRLQKDTVIYLEPICSHDEWLHSSVVLEQDATFAIMNDSPSESYYDTEGPDPAEGWVDILVSGYGKCWVHPDVAQDRSTLESPFSFFEGTNGITELGLVVEVAEKPNDKVLTEFFQLVGRGLVSLVLHTNQLREKGLGAVLRACPRLEKLQLHGAQVEDMFAFTHGYDAGYCQISSLSMETFQVSAASLEAFANVLSDPEREAARHLRELCVGKLGPEVSEESPAEYESMITAFVRMLTTNKTLNYLELHLDARFFPRFVPNFTAHHNEHLSPQDTFLQRYPQVDTFTSPRMDSLINKAKDAAGKFTSGHGDSSNQAGHDNKSHDGNKSDGNSDEMLQQAIRIVESYAKSHSSKSGDKSNPMFQQALGVVKMYAKSHGSSSSHESGGKSNDLIQQAKRALEMYKSSKK